MTSFAYYTTYETSYILTICLIALGAGVVWGCVTRTIMKNKGYQSLGGWFCCGFFLGLIGLVIALTRPDKRTMPFQNGNPYGQPPYGQPYPNQQFQGQPPYGQPYPNQQFQGQPMQAQQQGVRCPSCGMINPPDTAYCVQCGTKVK